MRRVLLCCGILGSLLSLPVAAHSLLLPKPQITPQVPKLLSLKEAIALALRHNPNVKIAELKRITDKFGLATAIWKGYQLQWDPLTFSSTLQKTSAPSWSMGTGVSVNAPTGTSASISYSNDLTGGTGQSSIKVTQHLLRGFSYAYNRIAYDSAIDGELAAQLNFKNSIINTVTSVISKYRSLVQDYSNLATNVKMLKNQKEEVERTKRQVKAGKMSRSTLLEQEASTASTKLSVVQAEDALRNSYQDFLSELGLDTSKNVTIDRHISIRNVHVPSKKEAIAIALKNNISYQNALISFRGTQRSLLSAKEERKWQLDMTGSVSLGSAGTAGPSDPSLGFNLSIPINDLSLKSAVVSAKISLEGARLNLIQQKRDLIRSVTNALQSIRNQYEQIKIAKHSVWLQQKTLENSRLQLKYGKTTQFETNSYVTQLVNAQIALTNAKISYLNDVTDLYKTLGITLDKWAIKLRY